MCQSLAAGERSASKLTLARLLGRLRARISLEHLSFQSLRRLPDTYGQDLGFSPTQATLRAGHDRAVAGKYYTGNVAESDRRLAEALAGLVSIPEMLD